MSAQPVGRFAPSPSGAMHLGNARTALLGWLDVRARAGRMLLRIEDLDRDRCRPGYADALRHDLEWLGLGWDAEVPAQSTRDAAYDAAIERLRAGGRRFECPAPDPPVVDRLAGEVDAAGASEIVVRRSDGLYAYHLAVVVDDAADKVTDVCRGDDLLPATAPQAGLQALLGLPRPAYAHVPLVLGPDGARLSKRHGAVAIADLRDAGIRPGEICGALARSAGLAAPGAVMPAQLVESFALERIERRPGTLAGLVPGG